MSNNLNFICFNSTPKPTISLPSTVQLGLCC